MNMDTSFVKQLNSHDTYFFWKGRVALYALLMACGVSEGDEVIMQAFTCVAVPNPVLYLGAKPVYVDVDPSTYTLDVRLLADKVSDNTKVIILQNTFGHPPDYKPIVEFAHSKGIVVIGDCAHGMGSRYMDKYDGLVADASIYSFQWTKPITTGLGGMAVMCSPSKFPGLSQLIDDEFVPPSSGEQAMLRLQYLSHKYLLRPSTYWALIACYRALAKSGLKVSSSSKEELVSEQMPDGFKKEMGAWQRSNVIAKLSQVDQVVSKRREAAAIYDTYCDDFGIERAIQSPDVYHSFLRYPVKVTSNLAAFEVAKQNRIQVGEWFVEPVDPSSGDEARLKYERGSCPVAESLCEHVINLPTDHVLSEEQFGKVVAV